MSQCHHGINPPRWDCYCVRCGTGRWRSTVSSEHSESESDSDSKQRCSHTVEALSDLICCFPLTRYNISTTGWQDDLESLPLAYQFIAIDPTTPHTSQATGSDMTVPTSGLPLSSMSPAITAVTNVVLPQPASGNTVLITVVARNVFGSAVACTAAEVTIPQPTLTDLQSVFNVTSTTADGDSGGGANQSGSNTLLLRLLQTAGASIAAQLASIDSSGSTSDSSSGNATSGTGTGSGLVPVVGSPVAAGLGVVALATSVLQTTSCGAVDCGSGVCAITAGQPSCDCTGTGSSGSHCEINDTVAHGGSSTNRSGLTGSASGTSASGSSLVCPSMTASDCSGHGECWWSDESCSAASAQCIAVCRCRSRYRVSFARCTNV